MPATLPTPPQVAAVASALPRWRVAHGAIRRDFRFAELQRRLGRSWRGWRCWRSSTTTIRIGPTATTSVDIALSSHDAGGLTARDVAMAQAIDLLG